MYEIKKTLKTLIKKGKNLREIKLFKKFSGANNSYAEALSSLKFMLSDGRYLNITALEQTLPILEKKINGVEYNDRHKKLSSNEELNFIRRESLGQVNESLSVFYVKLANMMSNYKIRQEDFIELVHRYVNDIYAQVNEEANELTLNLEKINLQSGDNTHLLVDISNSLKRFDEKLISLYDKVEFAYWNERKTKANINRKIKDAISTVNQFLNQENIFDGKLVYKRYNDLQLATKDISAFLMCSHVVTYPINSIESILDIMKSIQSIMNIQTLMCMFIGKGAKSYFNKLTELSKSHSSNSDILTSIDKTRKDLSLTLYEIEMSFLSKDSENLFKSAKILCDKLFDKLHKAYQLVGKIKNNERIASPKLEEMNSTYSIEAAFNTDSLIVTVDNQNKRQQPSNTGKSDTPSNDLSDIKLVNRRSCNNQRSY